MDCVLGYDMLAIVNQGRRMIARISIDSVLLAIREMKSGSAVFQLITTTRKSKLISHTN